jgi:hypothetical protein
MSTVSLSCKSCRSLETAIHTLGNYQTKDTAFTVLVISIRLRADFESRVHIQRGGLTPSLQNGEGALRTTSNAEKQ